MLTVSWKGQFQITRAVADRVSVDIEGMREEIENVYADNPLWSELSLSQKLRRLLRERLDTVKQERSKKPRKS